MKTLLPFLSMLFFSYFSIAQEISVAPVKEEFLQYIENKKNNNLKSTTIEGHAMGLIPTPFNFHFSETSTKLKAEDLPSSYDLRVIKGGAYLTSVKNQGQSGTCWTFGTYGSIESYLLKQDSLEQDSLKYDFSEQNLATCHGFDYAPNEGGTALMAASYFSRHYGPITEEDDPYTKPDESSSCRGNLTPSMYIEQAVYLPGSQEETYDIAQIKQAIIDYGALYVNMYYDTVYYNSTDYTYFYPGTEYTDHAVVLVGWNDSIIVSGGDSIPDSPGAWIIKNSWGENWGDNGFFYISYKDSVALSTIVYFPSAVEYNSNVNTYYYDECGMVTALGTGEYPSYALIKFTPNNNEYLKKIGTYLYSDNCTLNIEIYDNFNGDSLSNYLGGKKNITCSYPGYKTIELEDAISLSNKDDFYIKIYCYNPELGYIIPVEYKEEYYSQNTTIENIGKCWIGLDGDTILSLGKDTDYEYDLCINAYTTNADTISLAADFDSDIYSGEAPLEVTFEEQSEGNPIEWKWDLDGDSVIDSYEQNPGFTYQEAGKFTVSLIVENGTKTDTITRTNFIIVEGLTAEFDVDSYQGEAPLMVTFEDKSEGNPTEWQWDLNGDGEIDSNEQNPVYTYNETGSYTVTLIIRNETESDTITKKDLITIESDNSYTGEWVQKAYFGGGQLQYAAAFSINEVGYIGTGTSNTMMYSDGGGGTRTFYRYDKNSDVWNTVEPLPTSANKRFSSIGFSIENKGYICGGINFTTRNNYLKDLWEYNPETDIWYQRKDCPSSISNGIGFSIGLKGYVGLGANINETSSFYEYNPSTNLWTQLNDFPGESRQGAIGFSYNGKGYAGLGYDYQSENGLVYFTDLWEYNPDTDSWTRLDDFPGSGRVSSIGFGINNCLYIGMGEPNDFYKYDLSTKDWEYLSYIPTARNFAFSFCVENTIVYGAGIDSNDNILSDVWAYELSTTQTSTTSVITTEDNNTNINVYPNPTSDFIYFNDPIKQIKVYNLSGECVIDIDETCNQINISNLPTGCYIIRFVTENNNLYEQKIIKVK